MKFSVKFDSRQVNVALNDIKGKGVKKAKTLALNRAMKPEGKRLRKDLAAMVGVDADVLTDRVVVVDAKQRDKGAVAYVKTHPLRWPKVKAEPVAGGGVKLGNVKYNQAFFAQMPDGKEGYFQRRGRARLPIDQIGIDMVKPAARAVTKSEGRVLRSFQKHFPIYMQKEIDKVMAKRFKR